MGATPERAEPLRTCVGCRRTAPTSELVRCRLDDEGRPRCGASARRVGGRGAWICAGSVACFQMALRRGGFARAWRCALTESLVAELHKAFEGATDDMRQSQVAGSAGAPRKG